MVSKNEPGYPEFCSHIYRVSGFFQATIVLGFDRYLIVFMVGFIVFSRIIRPVIELSGFVERVSRRDFPQWIALPESYDEVSQLVSTSKGPIKVWRSHTM